MAVYFKIASAVCKAVSTECTEDKMHIFLQLSAAGPSAEKN